MKWANDDAKGGQIYVQKQRELTAVKKFGCDRDYTASEMKKMFFDLCTDFDLTAEGDYVTEEKVVYEFWVSLTSNFKLNFIFNFLFSFHLFIFKSFIICLFFASILKQIATLPLRPALFWYLFLVSSEKLLFLEVGLVIGL